MESHQLTVWEAKERAGLLALETQEWREKRRIAEDPDTSANVLERFSYDVSQAVEAWKFRIMAVRSGLHVEEDCQASLLAKAIAAHPNTPLDTLSFLISLPSIFNSADGFCQNPTAPFIVLEMPDFWERLRNDNHESEQHQVVAYERLLREESLPLPVIYALDKCYTRHTNESTRDYNLLCRPSLFHVSVFGEIQTESEGEKALTKFWKNYCKTYAVKQRENYKDYYHKALVESGLAPRWAAIDMGKANSVTHDSLSFSAIHQSGDDILSVIAQKPFRYTDFARFVVNLHGVFDADALYQWKREHIDWLTRLDIALKLPMTAEPFPEDQWNRSPLDLMHHLTRDGNRFVRWAAQTRLADPDFVFTWYEGDD